METTTTTTQYSPSHEGDSDLPILQPIDTFRFLLDLSFSFEVHFCFHSDGKFKEIHVEIEEAR